jgi:prolipoprotein diacylglyceryltransferase
MLPVFLDLKVLKIYTFGVFLVLAFFWASYLLWKNFLLTAHKEEDVFDGLFISLGVGLFISRLVYVVLNFRDFGFSLLKFILVNGFPGLSLYGFIGGMILGLYLFFLSRKIKFREAIDYFVPSSLLALGIGQIGVYFAGSESLIKAKYLLLSFIPLYKSLLFFLGAFLTYKILYAIRREKYFKGFNLIFFFWYYSLVVGVFDVVVDWRAAIFGLNFDTLLSFILLLTSTFYFLYYFRSLVFGRLALIRKQGAKKNGKKNQQISGQGIQGASRKR